MHAEYCDSLFAPRSMAIVGASEKNPYARYALARLDACGYAGTTHLVNPNAETVFGRRCHPSVASIGQPIDMAFVVVPRAAVMTALEEAAAVGAKGAVVISNGFGESHDELGRKLQAELADFVGRTPMAICGPSCLGIINVHGRFQAFGGHTGVDILPGSLALVSQSGANVHSYISAALARNIGFTYIVSSGNEVGLDVTDYLDYFVRDPNTRVICAYVESFRSTAKLEAVARAALAAGKPIITIKIGRSESSVRAALAHTGAMTGSDQFFDTLFAQFGVLRADTIEESLDRAVIFASSERKWWPRSGRVGLVSISGGFAAAFSDLTRQYRSEVPALQPGSNERLAEILPANVNPQNPVDISTQVQRDRPNAWAETLDCMAADSGVDLVVDAEALMQTEARLHTLLGVRARHGKPLLLASTSVQIPILDDALKAVCRQEGLPLMAGAEASHRALESSLRFTAAVATPKRESTGRRAGASLPRPRGRVLHEVESRQLLAPFGIHGPREAVVHTPEEAERAAAALGTTVALKIVSPAITHRSDRGLVRLDVPLASVRTVAAELAAAVADEKDDWGILVQGMARGVAELFIGINGTIGHTPMLVVGLGGIYVELLGDRVSRLCPIDVDEAARMLAELRLYPTLRGYRGRPKADIAAAARAIEAMSDFAMAARDWLAEAEINPLLLLREGDGVVAVDALISARPS